MAAAKYEHFDAVGMLLHPVVLGVVGIGDVPYDVLAYGQCGQEAHAQYGGQ